MVFDDPSHASGNKLFLQKQRDQAAGLPNGAASSTEGAGLPREVTENTHVPHRSGAWMKWLGNRKLKRQLVIVLSNLLPNLVAKLLELGQSFLVAGGFDDAARKDKAVVVTMDREGRESGSQQSMRGSMGKRIQESGCMQGCVLCPLL